MPPIRSALLIIIVCEILLAVSCELVEDFFDMAPPGIASYSPDMHFVNAPDITRVSIVFSKEMDRAKTESAFSLLREGSDIPGAFAWAANEMSFTPYAGFEAGVDYTMRVSTSSECMHGNSLPEEFLFVFSTKLESVPPEVLSISPANGAIVTDLACPIIFTFSEGISGESFYESFSISPPIPGSISFDSAGIVATFTPAKLYSKDTDYRIELDGELSDLSGNKITQEYHSYFTTTPLDKLVIISVIDSAGNPVLGNSDVFLNHGIEKDSRLSIVFDRPVESDERSGLIDVSPDVARQIDWSADYASCDLGFTDPLAWNEVYELVIVESVYRIKVDGPGSEPPEVERITFCNNVSSPSFGELHLNALVQFSPSSRGCFDFYFSHADAYSIDLGSFFNAVSISATNACVSFDFLSVERMPESPAPDPAPASDIEVLRLYVAVDSPGTVGTVTIKVEMACKDTNNNFLVEDFSVTVNKQ